MVSGAVLRGVDSGDLAVLTLLDLSAAFDIVDHVPPLRRLDDAHIYDLCRPDHGTNELQRRLSDCVRGRGVIVDATQPIAAERSVRPCSFHGFDVLWCSPRFDASIRFQPPRSRLARPP